MPKMLKDIKCNEIADYSCSLSIVHKNMYLEVGPCICMHMSREHVIHSHDKFVSLSYNKLTHNFPSRTKHLSSLRYREHISRAHSLEKWIFISFRLLDSCEKNLVLMKRIYKRRCALLLLLLPPPHTHTHTRARARTHTHTHTHTHTQNV